MKIKSYLKDPQAVIAALLGLTLLVLLLWTAYDLWNPQNQYFFSSF